MVAPSSAGVIAGRRREVAQDRGVGPAGAGLELLGADQDPRVLAELVGDLDHRHQAGVHADEIDRPAEHARGRGPAPASARGCRGSRRRRRRRRCPRAGPRADSCSRVGGTRRAEPPGRRRGARPWPVHLRRHPEARAVIRQDQRRGLGGIAPGAEADEVLEHARGRPCWSPPDRPAARADPVRARSGDVVAARVRPVASGVLARRTVELGENLDRARARAHALHLGQIVAERPRDRCRRRDRRAPASAPAWASARGTGSARVGPGNVSVALNGLLPRGWEATRRRRRADTSRPGRHADQRRDLQVVDVAMRAEQPLAGAHDARAVHVDDRVARAARSAGLHGARAPARRRPARPPRRAHCAPRPAPARPAPRAARDLRAGRSRRRHARGRASPARGRARNAAPRSALHATLGEHAVVEAGPLHPGTSARRRRRRTPPRSSVRLSGASPPSTAEVTSLAPKEWPIRCSRGARARERRAAPSVLAAEALAHLPRAPLHHPEASACGGDAAPRARPGRWRGRARAPRARAPPPGPRDFDLAQSRRSAQLASARASA